MTMSSAAAASVASPVRMTRIWKFGLFSDAEGAGRGRAPVEVRLCFALTVAIVTQVVPSFEYCSRTLPVLPLAGVKPSFALTLKL